VTLHVEDEFAAVERRARELHVQSGFLGNIEEAAGMTMARVSRIHTEQRGRGPARGDQETAPVNAEAFRVFRRCLQRALARLVMHRRERHGRILAVRGSVELDWKSLAVGIVLELHASLREAS
jgi:hypothetical protein